MFKQLLLKVIHLETVYAHCDIPCGIYDPQTAQIAAHTVLRMNSLINDLKETDNQPPGEKKKTLAQISRLVKVKEEHAELLKHEVRVIWGDYFKPDHLKDFPQLHETVFQLLKLASKARQETDLEISKQLLEKTLDFSEMFFKTKGLETTRVKSGFPTEGEIVVHK